MKQILREYGIVVGISFCAAILLRLFILEIYSISSPAMKPALVPGDQVLIFKAPYFFSNPLPPRGKVILIHPPEDRENHYIRRVIGLPGDRVEVKSGEILLNGEKIQIESTSNTASHCWREKVGNESFEACEESAEPLEFKEAIVPADSLFVVSDYRLKLSGPVPASGIIPKQSIFGETLLIWLSIHPEKDLKSSVFSRLRFDRLFSKVRS